MLSISGTNLLAYDYENRLTLAAFPGAGGATNTYQYDGAGNRLVASRAGIARRYVLDRNSPLSQVLAETDSSGNIIYYYTYGLGLISRIDNNNNSQFYHYDARGSTIALTDAGGQIMEAYSYDPFGRPIISLISDNRFRYLGRHGVMDEENGFLYIRARYYSTRRGRFITKDPTTGKDGDSQSMNRYIYALNNPVRLIDISGLCSTPANITGSSDLPHDLWLELQDLINRLGPSAAKEVAVLAAQGGITSAGGIIAYYSNLDPTLIGKATGALNAGIDIALIGRDVLYDPVRDTLDYVTAHPETSDLEAMARFFVNLSLAATVSIPRAYLDEGGAEIGSSAIGVGYDAYRTQLENAAYNGVNAYVNTVPALIENTYMNGINAAGNWLYQQTGF
jgi:RHS repeat-associated protein